MDIPLYISELLDEQDYVVVPGLGAFISSYRPAVFNDEKSLINPPSRMISFYPEIKSNDGVLAGIVSQHQKIPLSQASRLLEKFTGDILIRIENGDKADLGKLGSLSMANGELSFTPASPSLEHPEFYGLPQVNIRSGKKITDYPEVHKPERKKNKIPVYVWLGISFLLIVIPLSIFFAFLKNSLKDTSRQHSSILKDTLIIQPAIAVKSDTSRIQIREDSGSLVTADTAGVSFIHPRKELYYTIGGSFRSSQNASEYYDKMVNIGFHPIHLGLIGKYYLVALDTFLTAKDAYNASEHYSPVYRKTEIWVYHPE